MSEIRNISDSDIIRAFANYPLDDDVRENAIAGLRADPGTREAFDAARERVAEAYDEMALAAHDDPFRIICTDYELMLEYGDYGGVEIWTQGMDI